MNLLEGGMLVFWGAYFPEENQEVVKFVCLKPVNFLKLTSSLSFTFCVFHHLHFVLNYIKLLKATFP